MALGTESVRERKASKDARTANLRTKILDFRGFDSSIILISMGGILRPTGNFPEVLSQAILVVLERPVVHDEFMVRTRPDAEQRKTYN